MNDGNGSQYAEFAENARKTLIEAQLLCQDVNGKISEIKKQLLQWQQQVSRVRFVLTCMNRQAEFLYNGILQVGIEEQLIKKEWGGFVLQGLVQEMEKWHEAISKQTARLDSINNRLVSDKSARLGNFISKENLDILQKRLNEIPNVKEQIDNIKAQYQILHQKVREEVINGPLKQLLGQYELLFGGRNQDVANLGDKYPRTMDYLEHELVEYLNSLTEHYDKCKILVNLKDKNEQLELLHVVKKDNEALDYILEMLKDAINYVEHLVAHSTILLQKKKQETLEMKDKLAPILNNFYKYQEYLSIFSEIAQIIEDFKKGCLQDIQITQEFHHFYKQFEMSYNNLVVEAERRRKVAKDMEGILNRCKQDLETLQAKDRKAREEFLSINGDYLPVTIWPDNIDDLSPLYKLEYSVKKI